MVRREHWTFLTNHGGALLLISEEPGVRLADLAERLCISQRAAQMIVTDLAEAGYVRRVRVGRRNTYTIERGTPMRHRAFRERATVGALLRLLEPESGGAAASEVDVRADLDEGVGLDPQPPSS